MNEMTRILPAGAESHKARITAAQFRRMCDVGIFDEDDWKIELVDGELERMPPPKRPHSVLQGSVYAQLVSIFGAERTCIEIGIDLGDDTVFGCDVAVLLAPMLADGWPRSDEVLLTVEVSHSTLGRDLGMKVPRYAAAGVPHYWVIDSRTSVIYVHSDLSNGEYKAIRMVRFGEPLTVPETGASITLT